MNFSNILNKIKEFIIEYKEAFTVMLFVTVMFSLNYLINKPDWKKNGIILDSPEKTIDTISSIDKDIEYHEERLNNIKDETIKNIKDSYNLSDSAAIELFNSLVSKYNDSLYGQ